MMALIIIMVVAIVTILAYIKYRQGLGTKIFAIVSPANGFLAFLGFIVGKMGLQIEVLIWTVSLAVISATIALMLLLRLVVSRTMVHVDNLVTNANQLSATARQSSATAAEQASSVNQITSTIEESFAMTKTATENAQEVVKMANEAVDHGKEGLKAIAETTRVMESISQTTDILDMIGDLAEQSNLLAVNASIEAAKAGEYGRGFAVVASEVRNLAEQSKEATSQIRDAIRRTEEGVRAVDAADKVIKKLAEVLEITSDKSRQIAGAVMQQSTGMKQIS
ncbi:hypothetical protein JXQ70_06185, partial [bacterium]|nr:hypothetical protein [bacterium]